MLSLIAFSLGSLPSNKQAQATDRGCTQPKKSCRVLKNSAKSSRQEMRKLLQRELSIVYYRGYTYLSPNCRNVLHWQYQECVKLIRDLNKAIVPDQKIASTQTVKWLEAKRQ